MKKLTDAERDESEIRDDCIQRLERYLHCSLKKCSRASFSSTNNSTVVVCLIDGQKKANFEFGFTPRQKERLEDSKVKQGFIAFACGTEEMLLCIPVRTFVKWLDGMNQRWQGDRLLYWYVFVFSEDHKLMLHRKVGTKPIPLTKYLK